MNYRVFEIIGIITLLLGIGLFCHLAYFFYKKPDSTLDDIKKKKYFYFGGLLSYLVGWILLVVQFYLNPENIEYISNDLSTSVDGLHYFMLYFGVIIFAIFSYLFAGLFFSFYFLKKALGDKTRKVGIFTFVTLGISIITLFIFFEGGAPFLRYPLANRIYFGSYGIRLVTAYTGKSWSPIPSDGWGFTITFYALFILSGALSVLWICDHQLFKKYGQHGLISTCFLIAFPCGIIGARAWYVVGNWEREFVNDDWTQIFMISDGGLTIIGGAVFGIIAGVLYMALIKYKAHRDPYTKMNYLEMIDFIVPTILLAQAVGRWGNFMNNEVHGNAVDISSWEWLPLWIKNNMRYSSAHKGSVLDASQIYLPLFLIESMLNLLGYFVIEFGARVGLKRLVKYDENNKLKGYSYLPYFISCDGQGCGLYLIWYGTVRYFLEPLRDTNFNMGVDNNWSEINSLIMIGEGVLLMGLICGWNVFAKKKHIFYDISNRIDNKDKKENA